MKKRNFTPEMEGTLNGLRAGALNLINEAIQKGQNARLPENVLADMILTTFIKHCAIINNMIAKGNYATREEQEAFIKGVADDVREAFIESSLEYLDMQSPKGEKTNVH